MRACIRKGCLPDDYDETCNKLARNGSYVLALAFKELPSQINSRSIGGWDRSKVENDLTLVGLITFDNNVKVRGMIQCAWFGI